MTDLVLIRMREPTRQTISVRKRLSLLTLELRLLGLTSSSCSTSHRHPPFLPQSYPNISPFIFRPIIHHSSFIILFSLQFSNTLIATYFLVRRAEQSSNRIVLSNLHYGPRQLVGDNEDPGPSFCQTHVHAHATTTHVNALNAFIVLTNYRISTLTPLRRLVGVYTHCQRPYRPCSSHAPFTRVHPLPRRPCKHTRHCSSHGGVQVSPWQLYWYAYLADTYALRDYSGRIRLWR